jgi:hypothetical protein
MKLSNPTLAELLAYLKLYFIREHFEDLAPVPVYMIFDDHDVTDGWNLSRGREEAAYANPFSRRIIGNALIAYWLFQAWGNAPEMFDEHFVRAVRDCFDKREGESQDTLIDRLLEFDHWHYRLPTTPKLVVMDTRNASLVVRNHSR